MEDNNFNKHKKDIEDILSINIEAVNSKIIKVIGVGGGGSNAVTHMFKQGIHDVSFVLCNTDNQALQKSQIPVKIQLGEKTTQGLGAGNQPHIAKEAAEESHQEIARLFDDGTKMAFVTAGMGGGTGTGAAPYIAGIAKDMGVLTVGIVTIPFIFEGESKINQALDGVEELAKNVDALLVINNERLREIYKDLDLTTAFQKADDTLTIAAKSIAEIITIERTMNLDFADVKTTLKDGGIAIMSTGFGEGTSRVENAIQDALNSPLLNNNDIYNSKKIMINLDIPYQLKTEELDGLHEFMGNFTKKEIKVIWGYGVDEKLEDKVKITILATGFGAESVPGLFRHQEVKEEVKDKAYKEEKEKEREHKEQRISAFYGSSSRLKRDLQVFVFEDDDLDNDALINEVEAIPTKERTPSKLKDIKKLQVASVEELKNQEAEEENYERSDDNKDTSKTIHF